MIRPVSAEHRVSQAFGSMKTAGVAPSSTPGTVGWYVKQYGNYQPFGHAGCDIACPEGTPVHAIAAGTVLWADWGTKLPGDETNAGYRKRWYLYKSFPGIVTVIQHPGWIGVYAHLSAAHLNVGDTVTEAQVIGLSGGTGGVAAHLHVEALVDLTYKTSGGLIYGRTDPEPYFGSAGIGAMGTTITPVQEDDDMAQADVERIINETNTRTAQAQASIEATIRSVADAAPLKNWSYTNPELGGGDAFQILRDALASTNRLTDTVSAAAAKAAAGGADEATIKASVKEAITELLIAGASK